MAEKKSLLSKVRAAVKKVTAKPQVKKTAAKSVSGLKQFKSYTSKANEKYMSKSQITHFKKILNAEVYTF